MVPEKYKKKLKTQNNVSMKKIIKIKKTIIEIKKM